MLLQELIQLNEAKSSKYVLALISGKDGSIKGYFIDDGSAVSKKIEKAYDFSSKSEANKHAQDSNDRWILKNGDKFEVKNVPALTEATVEKLMPRKYLVVNVDIKIDGEKFRDKPYAHSLESGLTLNGKNAKFSVCAPINNKQDSKQADYFVDVAPGSMSDDLIEKIFSNYDDVDVLKFAVKANISNSLPTGKVCVVDEPDDIVYMFKD